MTERMTINIGFSVWRRSFLKRVLSGIQAFASDLGTWDLWLPNYYETTALHELQRQHPPPLAGQISGVPAPEYFPIIRRHKVPTVLVSSLRPLPPWAVCVEYDYRAIATLAVEHLAVRRVDALAFFSSTAPDRPDSLLYQEGLVLAAREHALPLHVYEERDPAERNQQQPIDLEHWKAWLTTLPPNTGVICATDENASRLYLAAERAGRTIGRDLLVLGLGNEEVYCSASRPSLSSIQLDSFSLGWTAAEALHRYMADGTNPRVPILVSRASLIERQSTRGLARTDLRVEQACALMHHHLGSISVEELARHLHIDRRHLHRLFLESLGRSPKAEIRRVRLETTKRLLLDSKNSLAAISTACGYSDQAHMSREIRRATGLTPSKFRLVRN